MPPVAALTAWHDFYMLAGTASATMIGLLFVAVSVGAGVFSTDRRAPLRLFLSASVVNFSLVLAVSLIVQAPWQSVIAPAGAVVACAAFGLIHSLLAWRDGLRDGLIASIDFEDRSWYLAMPIVGYGCLAGAGLALAGWGDAARTGLAAAIGVLLTAGIRNAWDITVWIVTRRRD